MPWKDCGVEQQRLEFVVLAQAPDTNLSALCRQFGISRRCGYKWRDRFQRQGVAGLTPRSRRPRTAPLAVPAEVALDVVRLRREHPHWGPKKLRALLRDLGHDPPSLSTVARILKRAGLAAARGRGRKRRGPPSAPPGTVADVPNRLWTVDHKGWWRSGDGTRCEPLTVRDAYSRFILCARPLHAAHVAAVQAEFARLFERFGLPEVIRCDNGGPFAAMTGPYGLTRLSAWWRQLGIRLERITPGQPSQNGAHERMHGDIARELQRQPCPTFAAERERLECWRAEYNAVRPHEALGMRRPGELYRRSPRVFDGTTPDYLYPAGLERRRVRSNGTIRLERALPFISEALVDREVGVEWLTLSTVRVWFCDLDLGEVQLPAGTALRPTASASSPLALEV